ncbi:hypothetical protein [Paraburkholderia bryophila]|uniref:Uncharacterized protein n=1 Tax=Paraburkholderia bryophila TaxID=420952 RepID=A0A7Y9WPQ9_9BURK|nr:hypothetical protein [Paraburkholderia bryophila]NYH24792.1 hypothetical protein [Paraburkholderia bryophila]
MSKFKSDLYDICDSVANEFSGWKFSSGQFKNKSLKHSDLIVHPGFGFERGTTPLQPGVTLNNKRAMKLSKELFGAVRETSIVNLQVIAHTLVHTPAHLRLGALIVEEKDAFLTAAKTTPAVEEITLDISEAYPVLVAMMKDGIAFIETHYDLGSEEALLKALPPVYTTRHENSPYDQMELQKGVQVCLAHTLLGDFEFVESYLSDEFRTIFPKRTDELKKIVDALPRLKKLYRENGSVI